MTILEAMEDDRAFGRFFRGDSWTAWKAFLAALFALPPTDEQRALYQKHTGRSLWPAVPFREAWLCCGRRSGKSLIAALISTYLAVFRDHAQHLGPGEVATAMVVSPDRRQSRIVGRFQRGFFRGVPALTSMVTNETRDSLELSNQTVLEAQTADERTLRGYSALLIINDEIAFLPTESNASPDSEILNAERPCLVSLPESLLLSISSPYARRGELWNAYERHFGRDDSPALFWKATSLEMNPSLDAHIIAAAFEQDAAVAQAEWNANFRSDCERPFSAEMLEMATDDDRPLVLPPDFSEEEFA